MIFSAGIPMIITLIKNVKRLPICIRGGGGGGGCIGANWRATSI